MAQSICGSGCGMQETTSLVSYVCSFLGVFLESCYEMSIVQANVYMYPQGDPILKCIPSYQPKVRWKCFGYQFPPIVFTIPYSNLYSLASGINLNPYRNLSLGCSVPGNY